MICPTCNAPNRDDAKFCKSCGQPLSVQPAPTSEVALSDHIPDTPTSTQQDDASSHVQQKTEEQQSAYILREESDDVSLEPTLILTPEKMIAYQSRRWQQQLERNATYVPDFQEADASKGEITPDQVAMQKGNADASSSTPATDKSEQAQDSGDTLDIADMPTMVEIPPSSDVEEIPPPPQAESSATSEESISPGESGIAESGEIDEEKKAGETEVVEVTYEKEKSETMQEPSEQQET